MDFALEPEQEEFRKTVRAFAEEVVAPRAEAMDPAVLDQMAGMGLFGLPFPERYGGMGADYFTLCLAIEELARVDSSVALTLEAAVGLGAMPIWRVGKAYSKIGWHASDTRELVFEDCRVPEENLLGERGAGLANFLRTLEEGRVAVAALGTGLCQGCVDECVKYARERQAFGQPIASFQAVAFKIADMELRAHTARLAWQRAATTLAAGEPLGRLAAIAKLYASEAAVTSAREAVQVHGGYGYMNEFPVARFYRDAKVLEIGEGTSEVMRILIARSLGLDPGR